MLTSDNDDDNGAICGAAKRSLFIPVGSSSSAIRLLGDDCGNMRHLLMHYSSAHCLLHWTLLCNIIVDEWLLIQRS